MWTGGGCLGTCLLPGLPWSDSLFPSQRSVVQATPAAPKASPVQQLTVQGLQPVHVAQEVCVSPSYLRAHLALGKLGPGWVGEGSRPLRPQGGNEATPGVLKGPALQRAPPLAVGLPFSSTRQFRAHVLLKEIWSLLSLRHGAGIFWSGCCVSPAAWWAAEAWSPARGRPR